MMEFGTFLRAVNDRPYKDGTIPSGSGKKRQHKSGARQACGAAADTERVRAKTIIDQVRHDLGPGPARRAVTDRPY